MAAAREGEREPARAAELATPTEPLPRAAVDALDAGMLAFIFGDDAAAVRAFTQALEASPGYDDALYMLGLARARLDDTEGAVDALGNAWEASDNVMLRDYAARKLKALGAPTPER